jgi:hypothetical protein
MLKGKFIAIPNEFVQWVGSIYCSITQVYFTLVLGENNIEPTWMSVHFFCVRRILLNPSVRWKFKGKRARIIIKSSIGSHFRKINSEIAVALW